jgi:hypothetical protein
MARRGIDRAWVVETLATPEWTDIDPHHPGRSRPFKAIAAFGGRVLRVVHWPDGSDIVVLTAHPDRDALKRKWRP